MSAMICGPAGQPGDVSVMSICTTPSVDADVVDETEVDDVQIELRILHLAQRELDLIGAGRRLIARRGAAARRARAASAIGRWVVRVGSARS